MKLSRVVMTMKTTKEEGTKNMEEGTRDEVEARTKGRGGRKRWREKCSLEKGQNI
jgi:hypothetical protein